MSSHRAAIPKRRSAGISAACALVLALAATASAQNDAADAKLLIERLGIRQGTTVAEIGAGDGALTLAIARHVGPSGRVLTTELGESALARLRAAVEQANAANVTVVEARADAVNLPDACCDAIFMRSVYHHFADPAAVNRTLLAALRPGGRLAVLDFAPPGEESSDPSQRDENSTHGVTAETVEAELRAAGFETVSSEARSGHRRGFIVVVRKPSADRPSARDGWR
ncbi:MAG TPA: methyltransferase domain-containing protein [Vicinamibacterales bacterium]